MKCIVNSLVFNIKNCLPENDGFYSLHPCACVCVHMYVFLFGYTFPFFFLGYVVFCFLDFMYFVVVVDYGF